MKEIIGLFNVSNTNSVAFLNDVTKDVTELQKDGQEVEVQYQVTGVGTLGTVLYSALIIGRK